MPTPEVGSAAATLGGALEDEFAVNPTLRVRGDVLDNHGGHMGQIRDLRRPPAQHLPIELAEPPDAGSKVQVWQALPGG